MDLLGKKVLVAGCGKSGLGAAGLLQKAGAVPVLFDENEKLDGKALCAREDYPKMCIRDRHGREREKIKELEKIESVLKMCR